MELEQLLPLPNGQLMEALDRVAVLARVTPEHKVALVRALRERGERVAIAADASTVERAAKRLLHPALSERLAVLLAEHVAAPQVTVRLEGIQRRRGQVHGPFTPALGQVRHTAPDGTPHVEPSLCQVQIAPRSSARASSLLNADRTLLIVLRLNGLGSTSPRLRRAAFVRGLLAGAGCGLLLAHVGFEVLDLSRANCRQRHVTEEREQVIIQKLLLGHDARVEVPLQRKQLRGG
jgi:hypothetical protein